MVWSFLLFSGGLLILLLFFPDDRIVTRTVGWEKRQYIIPARMKANDIRTVTKENFTALVFEGMDNGRQGVYVSLSFNAGKSFTEPIRIAEVESAIDTNPWVAVSGDGELTVMWQNLAADGTATRIFWTRSTDYGNTWSEPVELMAGYDMEILPRIFYDDKNRLHLFFHAYYKGAFNLFHTILDDSGKLRNPDLLIRLTENMKGAFFPSIHHTGSSFYMAWQGKLEQAKGLSDDIFFMKSGNYGRSWSRPRVITESVSNDSNPWILYHRESLYVAYQNNDEENWRIRIQRSPDLGENWQTPVQVSETNADCYKPSMSVVGNELLIFWYDGREGNMNVYVRSFDIGEQKLAETQRLSFSGAEARNPLPIFTGRDGLVIWEESDNIIGKNLDVYAPPPRIYSPTHSETEWSRENRAVILWEKSEDESGIDGYATITNEIPDFNPTIQNRTANVNRAVLPDLNDGRTYFHIRSIDGAGNFSRTVHFRLQVSKNPLPMPTVVSPTHPEGKSVDRTTARLNWETGEMVRLKGFLFSLSREKLERPENFTRDFSRTFEGLSSGNYFFSLAAVDRTNQVSEIATYHIKVGDAGEIEPDKLEYEKEEETEKERQVRRIALPSLDIVLPLSDERIWDRRTMKALLQPRNVNRERVAGYAVRLSREPAPLPMEVNRQNPILELKGLKNGDYVVTAACLYRAGPPGSDNYRWTKTERRSFTVHLEPPSSPMTVLLARLTLRMDETPALFSVGILLWGALLLWFGYGMKIRFHLRVWRFRLRSLRESYLGMKRVS